MNFEIKIIDYVFCFACKVARHLLSLYLTKKKSRCPRELNGAILCFSPALSPDYIRYLVNPLVFFFEPVWMQLFVASLSGDRLEQS